MYPWLKENFLNHFIDNALQEDLGSGDYTSLACVPSTAKGKAKLLVKENGILAGVELAKKIFGRVDKNLIIKIFLQDGSPIKKGDIAFVVQGKSQSILKAERLMLNCMQRMSGIATLTNRFVLRTKGTKAKILDTRKTTPNFRMLEKWAVQIGGGYSHRFGLYDMMMIKDNHIDFCGGIKQAIIAVNEYLGRNKMNLKIEIESRNIREVKEILSIGKVNRIMLDNFSPGEVKKAVKIINGKMETEVSGKINLKIVRQYAKCGVDFISVGALTHSVKGLDMSLKAV